MECRARNPAWLQFNKFCDSNSYDSLSCSSLSMSLAVQDVRLIGLYEPGWFGGFADFSIGIIVALLQSAGTVLLIQLILQIRSSSAVPRSPNLFSISLDISLAPAAFPILSLFITHLSSAIINGQQAFLESSSAHPHLLLTVFMVECIDFFSSFETLSLETAAYSLTNASAFASLVLSMRSPNGWPDDWTSPCHRCCSSF